MTESVGKTLKKIRESKHFSIEEVSEKTRIPRKIILNIEGDRLHEISSDFYARRFVKSYSLFLGAVEEKAIKRYLSGTQRKDTPSLLVEGEKVPGDWFLQNKKYIGVGILAIFGIWIFVFSFVQMKKVLGNLSARHKAWSLSRTESRTALLKRESEDTALKKESYEKETVELEIAAHYDTWAQVIGDGELLFRGILKKGAKDIWQAEKEIKLELGNAADVTLKLNGKNLGSPGKKREKKKIVITKDGIKD